MKRLPVASHLTEEEYKLFLEVYPNHNRSMDLETRKDYNMGDVVKIESSREENGLNIYFKNGQGFLYKMDGTWKAIKVN